MLLARRRGGRAQSYLLFAFLLTKGLLISRWLLFAKGVLPYDEHPYLYRGSGAGFFLLAPLLYLHIRALCYRSFRPRLLQLLHALPAAIFALLAVLSVHLVLTGWRSEQAWLEGLTNNYFWRVFWLLNFIQILFYIKAMLRTVRAYRAELSEKYSALERIDLAWLRNLLLLLILHWLFVVSRSVLGLLDLGAPALIAALDLFSITIFLVFTSALVIRGLGQLKLFPGLDEYSGQGKASLPTAELLARAKRLRDHMDQAKPQLSPDLTIDELADGLELPAWQLSRVINTICGRNFCSFINVYRVEEAKRLLTGPAGRDLNILQILLRSGFRSKSVFNEVFKKETGLTPSAYRRCPPVPIGGVAEVGPRLFPVQNQDFSLEKRPDS